MASLRMLLVPIAMSFVAMACSRAVGVVPSDAADEPVVPQDDAGLPETSVVPDAPQECVPGDVTSYAPQFKPPRPHAPACNADQIAAYYAACLDSKSTTLICNTFIRANPDCVACAESSETDPAWGPITWYDSHRFYYLNDPGCLVLATSDPSTVACGHAAQAFRGCEVTACAASCEEELEANQVHRFAQCEDASEKTVCASYYAAVEASCNSIQNDALTTCYGTSGETDADYVAGILDLFCGGGPASDAGADAAGDSGSDAATD
jgi:hypothetical protein